MPTRATPEEPSALWRRAQLKSTAVVALAEPVASKKRLERRPTASKSRTVAKGSRVSSVSSGYLYFLVLERSWWFCLVLALTLYTISILVCSLLAATAQLENTQEAMELEASDTDQVAPPWEQCLRFAAAHVITMSGGSVVPLTSWGHVLSWLQQVLGLLVNVFVFSVVLAKFQAPQSDLVWTEGACVAERDGVPHLLLRVGNLRCHTLYSPNIKITLLRRHVTREGESFFRRFELQVDQPATMSGVHTVAHAITGDSPLVPLLESGTLRTSMGADEGDGGSTQRKSAERLSIHAVVQAFDNVYGGDLSATSTYARGSVRFNARFEDMISSVDGRMKIEWGHFNSTVPLEALAQRQQKRDNAAQSETNVLRFAWEADPEPTPPAPDRPYISCGSARASYGDEGGSVLDAGSPRSALSQYCPYSTRLCLLLAEGGVDFVLIKIDLTDVQDWYKAAFLPGDAPAMYGTPGGVEGEGWVGGSKECRERAVAMHAGVARANEARSPVEEAYVASLGEALIFGGLAPRIAGSTAPKGSKVFAFMLKKTLGVEVATALLERTDVKEAMEEARSACRARLLAAIAEVSSLLVDCEARGGFLGGDRPDPSDINLGGSVYTLKSLLESGLADVPDAAVGLAAFGAESLDRYLDRWTARPSWIKVFESSETFNAAIVRSFANKLCTAAPDVCAPESVRAACVRARHIDARYRALLKAAKAFGGGPKQTDEASRPAFELEVAGEDPHDGEICT